MGRSGGSGGRSSGGSFGGSRSSGGRSGGSFGGGRSAGRSGGTFGGRSSPGRAPSPGGGFFGSPSGKPRSGGGLGGWFLPRRPPVVIVPTPVPVRPQSAGDPKGGGGSPKEPGNKRFGCATVVIVLAALVVLFALVNAFSGSGSNTGAGAGITRSTVRREALPKGSVNETSYYTDTLGWIGNQTQLVSGLKHFYQKTGVQPHLFITDSVNGLKSPSAGQLDEFANALYDELFTDEAHILLVFLENELGYMDRYVCGTQAKTVIDTEAADILLDYLDRYYYEQGLTDEQYFSQAFADAADRIMTVTRSPWIPVIITILVLIGAYLWFLWWKQAKEQKLKQAKETERILKTPLERFGDTEAHDLLKKYDDVPSERRPDSDDKPGDK